MLWVIISILVTLGFMVYFLEDLRIGYYTWGEVILSTILTAVTAFASSILVLIISSEICDSVCDKTWYTSDDVKIYALQDNVSASGSFFLGSGHVDGKLKYFYVEETELGYAICNVDADDTYIKYTDGECHMEVQSYEFNHWFAKLIAAPIGERRIFYIPEGSIVQNYTIDLQ